MFSNRKGFVDYILAALFAVIAVGAGVLYTRYEIAKQEQQPTFGAQVYTTQLSDTINTFRNEVNSSTANLNTELEQVSSTVLALGNLSTLNSPLPVANGGTGTTTVPTDSQIMSASGGTPTWKVLVAGSGITIATSTTSTTLSTPGFNPAGNFSFTGNNTHSGTETFNGTTTAPYLAPVGAIDSYVSSTAPNGWLLCNGTEVATATYPSLFALIGYTYGGSTSTFKTPNIGGRTIFAPSSTLSTTLGATGGATSTAVSFNVVDNYNSPNGNYTGVGSGYPAVGSTSNGSTTASTVPPYIIEQFIIKY